MRIQTNNGILNLAPKNQGHVRYSLSKEIIRLVRRGDLLYAQQYYKTYRMMGGVYVWEDFEVAANNRLTSPGEEYVG